MKPNPANEAPGWWPFLLVAGPIVIFLLLLLRLGRKQSGHVDRAMDLAERQLAAQLETNRLLQRLIDDRESDL